MQNLWQIQNQLFTEFYIRDFFPYSIGLNYRNFPPQGFLQNVWRCSLFMAGQMGKINEHGMSMLD